MRNGGASSANWDTDCSHRQASGVLTEYGLSFKRTYKWVYYDPETGKFIS